MDKFLCCSGFSEKVLSLACPAYHSKMSLRQWFLQLLQQSLKFGNECIKLYHLQHAAYCKNVNRCVGNINLLVWHKHPLLEHCVFGNKTYCIDLSRLPTVRHNARVFFITVNLAASAALQENRLWNCRSSMLDYTHILQTVRQTRCLKVKYPDTSMCIIELERKNI